jgi:hypothetical protein
MRPRFDKNSILCFLIGSLLLIYSSLRAALLSFTFDEASTYLDFARGPWSLVLLKGAGLSPTNHFLNTAFIKLLAPVLGLGELALRLPNVLAHLLYLIATYRLVRPLQRAALVVGGFLLLNTNPFVLDFFSLARGYGLGLGFLAASLACLDGSLRSHKRRVLWEMSALCFAFLSVLSNLTFLLFFASLAGLFFLLHWGDLPKLAVLAVLMILGGAFAVPPLWTMQKIGALYFGGTAGFWTDTVSSLIECTMYDLPVSGEALLGVEALLVLVLVGGWLTLIVGIGDFNAHERIGASWPALLVLGCSLASMAAHKVFGVRFPIERSAILFVPLFFMSLLYTLWVLAKSTAGRAVHLADGIAIAAAMACLMNLAAAANVTHARSWEDQSDVKEFFRDLTARHSAEGGGNRRLAATWTLLPSAEYYRVAWELTWLSPIERLDANLGADYYFARPWQKGLVRAMCAVVLRRYPQTGNVFAQSPWSPSARKTPAGTPTTLVKRREPASL